MNVMTRQIEGVRAELLRKKSVQLLLDCGAGQRAQPSLVARSAIFGVLERGTREHLQDAPVAAWGSTTISFSGELLDQADLDTWLAVLHHARQQIAPCLDGPTQHLPLTIKLRHLLQSMGRPTGGKDLKWLADSLYRLTGRVTLRSGSSLYAGGLVSSVRIERLSTAHLTLNSDLAELFAAGNTLVSLTQRQHLRSDLAKWLHGFLASHQGPALTITTEKLRDLCRSRSDTKHFRQALKKACAELADIGQLRAVDFPRGAVTFVFG